MEMLFPVIHKFTEKGEDRDANDRTDTMRSHTSDDIWDRRRRNLRAVIAWQGTNPSRICQDANLSVNTLNKFLRGDTRTMRWESLERICAALEISNTAVLDSQNPWSENRKQLHALVEAMSEDEARDALNRLLSRQA